LLKEVVLDNNYHPNAKKLRPVVLVKLIIKRVMEEN
jgi:hypothetical protein